MLEGTQTFRVAVVGDRASVLGFKALGVEVFTPASRDETRNVIDSLAREGAGVIYLTERLAAEVQETLERYRSALVPAIIPIPDRAGSLGLGREAIQRRVEKAVGQNILAANPAAAAAQDTDDTPAL